ncbi:MAG: hypothetical protein KF708_19715 [Pirellulales bacterium]|nr:hypothetical protein [Pirellulales bacterium]
MASTIEPNVTSRPGGEPEKPNQGRYVEYEQFIAAQIRKTRGQVKGVEIAGAILRLLVGALVYLLVVAFVDHWILSQGLGLWGRLSALALFIIGVGSYLALYVAPLIARRVNPIYAAHTIEQHQPTLKNSLVNFLLLRGSRRELAPAVYQAIEQRAASDLTHVPVDTVVDRTRLVRWSYALLVVVAVFALYVLLSPKDPLRSLARMIAPWADLRPPTRVTIEEVRPGNTQAFHGDTLNVSARVRGVRSGEPVTLFYSTDDGQTVDRAIVMNVPDGGYSHEAILPESSNGLQQGVTYYVAAGDFATERYHVEILTAPSILVEAVDYEYPSYASIANGRVERVGDIKALVGTKVTIHGRANRPIKSAHIDFDCDGKLDPHGVDVKGQATSVSFDLNLDDKGNAQYGSYQLIFVSTEDRENPQPIRHTIAVVPDQLPTVELVLPEQADLEVPLNGVVNVAVRAADPDFALRDVLLHARRGDDVVLKVKLLDNARHEKEYRGAYVLDLSKLTPEKPGRPKLAAGDVIEYWAEARDIKLPRAGHAESTRYKLRVTSPTDQQQREEQLAEAQQEKQEFEKPSGGSDSGQGTQKEEFQLASRDPQQERQDPQQQPGNEEAAEQPQRVDPERDPAAAMKELLKHQEEKKEQPARDEQPNQQPEGEDGPSSEGDQGQGKSGEQQKPGSEPSQQPGEQQQGEQGQEGGNSQGGQSGGEQSSESSGSSPSNGAGGEQKGGGQSQAQSSAGGSQSDTSSDGQTGQGDNQQGGGQSGGDAGTNAGQAGDSSQGGKPSGKPGEGQPDERVRGEQDAPGEGRQERRTDKNEGANDQPGSTGGKPKPDDANRPGEAQPSGNAQQQEQAGQQPGKQGASGTEAPGKETDKAQGEGKAGESQEDSPQSETQQNQPRERSGQGAQSGQSGDANKAKSPPSDANVNDNAQGGEPDDPKGESGAGQAQGNEQGSPSPQEQNRPKEKQQQSPDSKNKESSEASSPTTSPRESDSQGGEEGDRSGGGQEGGGQKANQKGTGGAGQNTAADEGGGAAEGSGGGPTSDQSGNKQPGGQGEGQSQGAGGSGGEQGSGSSSSSNGGSSAGGQPGQGSQGAKPDAGDGGQGAGGLGGGGQNNHDEAAPRGSDSTPEPGGDEVDLAAARKATDLVLERLEDQLKKNDLDEELLERLGWTRQDVENFVKRWHELRDKAGDPSSPAGAKRFDDTLRQLGLRGSGTVLDGNENKPLEQKQLRESFRSTPPADYAEQYRAYTQGLSRGRPSPPPQNK